MLVNLLDPIHPWTVFNISHDAEVVIQTDTIHVLKDGSVVESGTPRELATKSDSNFAVLFPELTRQVLNKNV